MALFGRCSSSLRPGVAAVFIDPSSVWRPRVAEARAPATAQSAQPQAIHSTLHLRWRPGALAGSGLHPSSLQSGSHGRQGCTTCDHRSKDPAKPVSGLHGLLLTSLVSNALAIPGTTQLHPSALGHRQPCLREALGNQLGGKTKEGCRNSWEGLYGSRSGSLGKRFQPFLLTPGLGWAAISRCLIHCGHWPIVWRRINCG